MSNTETLPAVPFLIVVDSSGSMKENGGIDLINRSLPNMARILKDKPDIEETASVGLLSFAEGVEVHRQIEPLTEDFTVPPFKANGRTSYAAPLERMRSVIAEDLPKLSSRGRRPVAFFITDGKPNFEKEPVWKAARARLLDDRFRLRPKLVALGCGEVDPSCLEELASDPSLAQWQSGPTREALQAILRTVRGTIITLTEEGGGAQSYQSEGPDDLVARIFEFDDYETGPKEVFEYQPA